MMKDISTLKDKAFNSIHEAVQISLNKTFSLRSYIMISIQKIKQHFDLSMKSCISLPLRTTVLYYRDSFYL